MNDRIILAFFLYLIIASTTIGLLPSAFFTGTNPNDLDVDDLTGDISANPTALTTQLSFFGKMIRYMFVPIVIDGIPVILAIILQLFHTLIFVMSTIYFAKIIRGVSP